MNTICRFCILLVKLYLLYVCICMFALCSYISPVINGFSSHTEIFLGKKNKICFSFTPPFPSNFFSKQIKTSKPFSSYNVFGVKQFFKQLQCKGYTLRSVVMYQQLWTFLHLCQILCHYVPYSYSKTLVYGKNICFGQDILVIQNHDFCVEEKPTNFNTSQLFW